jgi:hypothetical protein
MAHRCSERLSEERVIWHDLVVEANSRHELEWHVAVIEDNAATVAQSPRTMTSGCTTPLAFQASFAMTSGRRFVRPVAVMALAAAELKMINTSGIKRGLSSRCKTCSACRPLYREGALLEANKPAEAGLLMALKRSPAHGRNLWCPLRSTSRA